MVYAFPGKEPFLVGTWTDELAAVEINGRHLLKRTQMADYAKYNIVTTYVNVFDSKTMSPISMDFKRNDTGEWAHRDFDGARVKYRRGASGDEAQIKTGQLEMKEAIFDYNGGMYRTATGGAPTQRRVQGHVPYSFGRS